MDDLVERILSGQNQDGGWGFLPGKSSNTECTSLCLLALDSLGAKQPVASTKRGLDWLVQRQRADGSWPLSDSTNEASWTTALAIIALNRFRKYQLKTRTASDWLLKQEGRTPGVLARLIGAFVSHSNTVALNPDLKGWAWVPRTFSWVEPTSYALVALKQVRTHVAAKNLEERIQQGEMMIYDRMCSGGGWNYGNSKVFGDALWPYPDVTAVALIALQDHQLNQANQESVSALRKMMQETDSGLALCWGTICLSIYGDETSGWKRQIEKRFQTTGFLGEAKTLALALVASLDHVKAFRL
jgi:hypothetical protein